MIITNDNSLIRQCSHFFAEKCKKDTIWVANAIMQKISFLFSFSHSTGGSTSILAFIFSHDFRIKTTHYIHAPNVWHLSILLFIHSYFHNKFVPFVWLYFIDYLSSLVEKQCACLIVCLHGIIYGWHCFFARWACFTHIEFGSEQFELFLAVLGEKIRLKGWERFRGGLDVKGT